MPKPQARVLRVRHVVMIWRNQLEARAGIEPAYTDLQSALERQNYVTFLLFVTSMLHRAQQMAA